MTRRGPAPWPRAGTGLTGLSCPRELPKTWLSDCVLEMEEQPGASGVPLCCSRSGRKGKEGKIREREERERKGKSVLNKEIW